MKSVNVLSPGKIILFGEHSVVYGEPGIAAAIDVYSDVSVSGSDDDCVCVESNNFEVSGKMNRDELFGLVGSLEGLKADDRVEEIRKVALDYKLVPSFFVVGNFMRVYGYCPVKIFIDSAVPKNLGSSASVFTGVAKGVSEYLGAGLDAESVGIYADRGDYLVHGDSSGIDGYTIAYGGWIFYCMNTGVECLDIDFELHFAIVDSGHPAKTCDTVAFIKRQMDMNPEYVGNVMGVLGDISLKGLESLRKCDIYGVGRQMNNYYEELRKLGVSTPVLDEIVAIAKDCGAVGVKPTGGWGGGTCIVLAEDSRHCDEIIEAYKSYGFDSFSARLGVDGAKVCL